MSSEGPKMVERRYGLAGNGLKWLKNQEKPDNPRWPPIRARLGAVGRETSRPASSGCPSPPCPALVVGGWPEPSPLV